MFLLSMIFNEFTIQFSRIASIYRKISVCVAAQSHEKNECRKKSVKIHVTVSAHLVNDYVLAENYYAQCIPYHDSFSVLNSITDPEILFYLSQIEGDTHCIPIKKAVSYV